MGKKKALMLASVASMIDQFNMPNIRLLKEIGYEVHVMCNFKEGNTCSRHRILKLQKILQTMGVLCHSWECPRSIWPVHKCIKAYCQLLRLTERYSFSLMHCHSPVGGAIARIVAHRREIPVIYTAHGFHFYKGAPLKNWLFYYTAEKILAQWTDVLVTVNQEDYCVAKKKLCADKVVYIPGIGIDLDRFQMRQETAQTNFRKEYGISKTAVILLSVGELSKRKNHKVVLSALSELTGREICYLILGQGKLKEMLLRKADSLGIADRVSLLGFQEDVAWFYQNADLFLFPSKQEGLSVALMEAMACGLACVVSDIRGNRELIADAMRFPPDQPKKLESLLKMLLDQPKLCQDLGVSNKEKIKKYDLKIVNSRMKKIYCQMGRMYDK